MRSLTHATAAFEIGGDPRTMKGRRPAMAFPVPDDAGRNTNDLARFITAQDGVFESALAEIKRGKKRTHWMWFIFPQLRGLGSSEMSFRYGIASLDEAARFLRHDVLGCRLRLAVSTLQNIVGKSAEEVFGHVDSIKLGSSLTLFGEADESGLFAAALQRWFRGQKDEATLKLIAERTGLD